MKVKIKATDKAKHMIPSQIYETSKANAELLISRGWAVDPDAEPEQEKPKRKTRKKQ